MGREPVDEAVAVLGLYLLIVVGEADNSAVGANADQQGPAVGVQERGNGLDDGVLHGPAGLVLSEVPAGGGFELDGVVLVVVDEFLDGAELGLADQAELLGDEGEELGVGAASLHD